jgi:hypothetical protein
VVDVGAQSHHRHRRRRGHQESRTALMATDRLCCEPVAAGQVA